MRRDGTGLGGVDGKRGIAPLGSLQSAAARLGKLLAAVQFWSEKPTNR